MSLPQTQLESIEAAITHQERVVEELSAVIQDQASRVERLERQIALLARRLATAEGGVAVNGFEDRPPPHW